LGPWCFSLAELVVVSVDNRRNDDQDDCPKEYKTINGRPTKLCENTNTFHEHFITGLSRPKWGISPMLDG